MNLFLLRHSDAFEADHARFPTDESRALTEKGSRRAQEVGKAMRRLDLGIDPIWSSPYVRARQTAEIVAQELEISHLELCDKLAPNGDGRQLMDAVADLDPAIENLLLTGHEPLLSTLLSVLTTGTTTLRVEFKKCGLARLELVNRIALERCARLIWLVPPRLLE